MINNLNITNMSRKQCKECVFNNYGNCDNDSDMYMESGYCDEFVEDEDAGALDEDLYNEDEEY